MSLLQSSEHFHLKNFRRINFSVGGIDWWNNSFESSNLKLARVVLIYKGEGSVEFS